MKNDPRLKRYAMAATTVPVAALATTAPVAGEIIFEEVDITIGGFVLSPETTSLNIGGYGSVRFLAGKNLVGPTYLWGASQTDNKADPTIEFFVQGGGKYGAELRRFDVGELINFGDRSGSGLGASFNIKGGFNGQFAFGGSGYLGFSIEDGNDYRYGWISVNWNNFFFDLTINGYAYETDLGVGVQAGIVPAPGALGLFGLAAGAAGIRRKRKA